MLLDLIGSDTHTVRELASDPVGKILAPSSFCVTAAGSLKLLCTHLLHFFFLKRHAKNMEKAKLRKKFASQNTGC